MRLCLKVGFVDFIFKRIKYFEKILNDVAIPHALCNEKTLCTTSSVSERVDMDSENHSVVIRSIGLHSVKSTVSRVITFMGILKSALQLGLSDSPPCVYFY